MDKRKIEVFTAGCPVCQPEVDAILAAACDRCDVVVYDLSTRDQELVDLAARHGIRRLPAVVIDDRLASCCDLGPPDIDVLRAEGLGGGE